MNVQLYIAVAIGGALGSVSRVALIHRFQSASSTFPTGVTLVNIVGSFILGAIAAYFAFRSSTSASTSDWLRVFLSLGFLGGFTTFSTFSYDTVVLLRSGQYSVAILHVLLQVIGGIIAAALGVALCRLFILR